MPRTMLRVFCLAVTAVAAVLPTAIAPAEGAGPRPGAVVSPVRLVPTGSTTIGVGGLHSYLGSIELSAAPDGLVVSNRLALERYLLGLNEVPRSWPVEALRAQAVAARTYALYTLARPRAGAAALHGFDICASVQCQVFSGADVVRSTDGERWLAAVAATRGEAVVHDGRPILARYHSTSGGATLANAQAFPDESNHPYLRPVSSTTEGGSPLYRWRVRFGLGALERILRRAGWWDRAHGRLLDVSTVASRAGLHYPDVVYRGSRRTFTSTADELRDVVRELAPALFDGRYPSRAATASGRLPETFPSNRLEIRTRRGVVRVVGRGWGHGVGMSQWGAHGMAAAGASYREILTHYYTGVDVVEVADPGAIEVGVAWGLPSVAAHGSFTIVDGRGRTVVRRALGTWRFHRAGTGVVSIDPPVGYGLPLTVGIARAPRRVVAGDAAAVTVALSRPARVVAGVGLRRARGRGPIADAGRTTIGWRAPRRPGTYRLEVRASAGPRSAARDAVRIEVVAPPPGAAPAPPAPPERGLAAGLVAGAIAVNALALALLAVTMVGWKTR